MPQHRHLAEHLLRGPALHLGHRGRVLLLLVLHRRRRRLPLLRLRVDGGVGVRPRARRQQHQLRDALGGVPGGRRLPQGVPLLRAVAEVDRPRAAGPVPQLLVHRHERHLRVGQLPGVPLRRLGHLPGRQLHRHRPPPHPAPGLRLRERLLPLPAPRALRRRAALPRRGHPLRTAGRRGGGHRLRLEPRHRPLQRLRRHRARLQELLRRPARPPLHPAGRRPAGALRLLPARRRPPVPHRPPAPGRRCACGTTCAGSPRTARATSWRWTRARAGTSRRSWTACPPADAPRPARRTRRYSQRKKRPAAASPTTAHTARMPRSPHGIPAPCWSTSRSPSDSAEIGSSSQHRPHAAGELVQRHDHPAADEQQQEDQVGGGQRRLRLAGCPPSAARARRRRPCPAASSSTHRQRVAVRRPAEREGDHDQQRDLEHLGDQHRAGLARSSAPSAAAARRRAASARRSAARSRSRWPGR